MNKIRKIIAENDLILMEGAVVEILRRSGKVIFHPDLIHSHLIYDKNGVNELTSIFKSYLVDLLDTWAIALILIIVILTIPINCMLMILQIGGIKC